MRKTFQNETESACTPAEILHSLKDRPPEADAVQTKV